jgi:nitrite reductase (NADH) small subunit/3-phenylpropionate/trans-cinnamate dioxygenase ferredoxin subunit
MSDFVTVARVGDVAEGRGRTFRVAGRDVALFLLHGRHYALDDYCPHMGASLGDSALHGELVLCNRHMWGFSVIDGSSPDVPTLKAETFEVRVVGDEIQVLLPGPTEPPASRRLSGNGDWLPNTGG